MKGKPGSFGRDATAVILAVGIALAINLITFAVVYDAVVNPGEAGLSENATQVLTTAFGGIIGVLGGFVGYQRGLDARKNNDESPPPEDDELP